MGLSVKASFRPSREMREVLGTIRAPALNWILSRGLLKCAHLALENITTKQIIRGGRRRGPPGPRGGRGKMISTKPHPTKLTSRSGDLRRSLSPSFGIDKSGLPRYLEIGTDLVYGAAHEFGSPKRHLPPRPFIRPGMEAVEAKFPKIFEAELRKELGL